MGLKSLAKLTSGFSKLQGQRASGVQGSVPKPQGCSRSQRQAPCCHLLLAPLLTLNSLGDKMLLPARQGQAHRTHCPEIHGSFTWRTQNCATIKRPGDRRQCLVTVQWADLSKNS